jgi:protein-tyrosine phosphatase
MFIPGFENDWITDRLKAGRNPLTADDVRSLAEDGITHVLDLREPHEWEPPRLGQEALDEMAARGLERLHLPIEDVSPPTLETLDTAVAFIDDALMNPAARVYVHCRAGMERTACVLVAWHARAHGVDYDTALAALRRGRPVLSPLPDQTAVTREWIARNVEGRET